MPATAPDGTSSWPPSFAALSRVCASGSSAKAPTDATTRSIPLCRIVSPYSRIALWPAHSITIAPGAKIEAMTIAAYPGGYTLFVGDTEGIVRLNAEINEVLKAADVPQKLRSIGFDVITTSPTEAMDYFKSEVTSWDKMARAIGFSTD
jgi:hypothetical protein